jgi:hypothetical protein
MDSSDGGMVERIQIPRPIGAAIGGGEGECRWEESNQRFDE